MPIYEYAPESGECDRCHGCFSLLREINAPALTHCPACLKPVRKLISRIGGTPETDRIRSLSSDSAIAEAGLSKYVKSADGTYVRTAGQEGPDCFGGPDAAGSPSDAGG